MTDREKQCGAGVKLRHLQHFMAHVAKSQRLLAPHQEPTVTLLFCLFEKTKFISHSELDTEILSSVRPSVCVCVSVFMYGPCQVSAVRES